MESNHEFVLSAIGAAKFLLGIEAIPIPGALVIISKVDNFGKVFK